MRIIDRYVIRQILMPFVLGLVVFTFLLMLKPLQEYAETLVAKGIPGALVIWLMGALIPQALALTIPMALLLGLLVGFGRLSADREFVAMQACGIGLRRLLLPVATISLLATGLTAYMWFYGYPAANQAFREVTFNIIADRAEGEVRPRVFYTDFPNLTLFVRDVPVTGEGWNGVFMADSRPDRPQATYLAKHGRIAVDRKKRTVEVVLEDTVRHTVDTNGNYDVARFEGQLVVSLDPNTVFAPPGGQPKGVTEMTVAELRASAAERERQGQSSHNEWIAIHRKFAVPFACVVFGVLGMALGATNRRDGTMGSFVMGVGIVFAYYVPLYLGPQLSKGGIIPAWVAAWLPNFLMGTLAAAAFFWRERIADQPLRFTMPAFIRRRTGTTHHVADRGMLRLLDRYVSGTYLRILFLSAGAMLVIFYISTFVDRADKLFKGDATLGMLAEYFYYLTPQYLYYIIPLSVLLATLVTVAMFTRSSELIVMKACGISLYRITLPMLICALTAGGVLFALDDTILGPANRRAENLKRIMNGASPESLNAATFGWVLGPGGTIHHFRAYDPVDKKLTGIDSFDFDREMQRITRRTYIESAAYHAAAGPRVWQVRQGWWRDFDQKGEPTTFEAITDERRPIEEAAIFGTERPDPLFLRFRELRDYTARMVASGYNMFAEQVWIARRMAFPFVTIIMTLIAVPFAVTVGRGGAMAGIGVGIGLALVYWTTISIFAALGSGGLIAPALAAWSPNLLFGAAATYLLLTVRT